MATGGDPNGVDMFAYDPYLNALREELRSIDERKRVAFAAKCAEHLFPYFRQLASLLHTADAELFMRLLEAVWTGIADQSLVGVPVDPDLRACESFYFGEEDGSDSWPAATDAAQALWLTLRACKWDSAENAALAGGCMLDRLDRTLVATLSRVVVGGVDARESERINREIRSHPSILAEMAKHQKWLEFLKSAGDLESAAVHALRAL